MALERWLPGENKSAIPTASWNAFCDAAELFAGLRRGGTVDVASQTVKVRLDRNTPYLHAVGLERPSPDPLGGLVTATAEVASATSDQDVQVTDAEVTNRGSGTTPSSPTVASQPGGQSYEAGESVALLYDEASSSWSIFGSGQRGGQRRREIILSSTFPQERHASSFAIVQRGGRTGDIVQGVLSGATWAALDVQAESDQFAAPVANAADADLPITTLATGSEGARILWKEPGLGLRYGIVLLGGGSGGGSSSLYVLVCEDLPGYSWDGLEATPGAVKCLPINVEAGSFSIDHEADWIEAIPREGVAISLGDTGCGCNGDGGSEAPAGKLSITTIPGRVTSGSITIGGAGVANDSTVTVSISDGTTTKTAASVAVNSDGTWLADPIDPSAATALTDGVLKVTAQETTIDSVAQAAVSHGLVYFATSTNSTVPGKPSPPDLVDASDTGTSNTDNRTADDTPTFLTTYPAGEPAADPTGPEPWIVIDGVVAATGAFDAMFDGSEELTVGQLANGHHVAQFVLVRQDPSATPATIHGTISDSLYFVVDPSADEDPVPSESTPVGRTGTVTTINGTPILENLGPCPVPLPQEVIDKLAALETEE